MPKGGALKPVYIVTDAMLRINGGDWTLQQGSALKVRGFTTDTMYIQKMGDALPVYVVPEAGLEINGGRWKIIAGQPIKVTDVIGATRGVIQGAAIPVCPVDDNGNYDPTFAGGGPPPWNPLDHPSTKVWIDANQITGLVDGNPVPLWEDLIGTIVGFDQGTAAKRPLYKTGVQNGLPVVRFDGTDDYLHATAEFENFQDPTLWMVVKGGNVGLQFLFSDYGSAQKVFQTYLNAGTITSQIRDSASTSILITNGLGTSFVIIAVVVQTAIKTLRLFRNEVEANGNNPAYAPTTWEGFYLDTPSLGGYPGGSSVLVGDIGEAIWCDNLDAADRPLFWTYLNNKWAVY